MLTDLVGATARADGTLEVCPGKSGCYNKEMRLYTLAGRSAVRLTSNLLEKSLIAVSLERRHSLRSR